MDETEIVEIPIADANAEEAPAPPEIVEPAPQAKKRGRPKGSKNKKEETVVPKPRKKIKIVSPPSESEEEQPSPKRRRVAAPQPPPPVYEPPDTRAIAAEVLTMLAHRHVDRSAAKREKYRSWFANPV